MSLSPFYLHTIKQHGPEASFSFRGRARYARKSLGKELHISVATKVVFLLISSLDVGSAGCRRLVEFLRERENR